MLITQEKMVNVLLIAFYIILTGVEVYTQEGQLYYRCPKNFFRAGNKCYYLSQDKASWRDAHFKCQDMSKSTLAVPDKKMQDKNLRFKLNKKRNVSHERWIGGRYDWGRGFWVWGTTGKKIRYQAFSRRQKETNYHWKCIVMDPQTRNRWGIRSCLEEKHFICEHNLEEVTVDSVPANSTLVQHYPRPTTYPTYPPYPHLQTTARPRPREKRYACPERYILVGTNCYHLSRDKLSWREANFKCSEMDNSNLVILDTDMTDRRLRVALKKRRRGIEESWIGGIYNWQRQIWIWGFTGCSIWYQDFLKNKTQINEINQGHGWHCIVMDPTLDYRWNSRSCFDHKHYICERPARKLDETGMRSDYTSPRQRMDQSMCDLNNTL